MMTDPEEVRAEDEPEETDSVQPEEDAIEESVGEAAEEAVSEETGDPEESAIPDEVDDDSEARLTPEFCRRVEAILFASEQPISARRIAAVIKGREGLVRAAIHELRAQYDLEKHAFGVIEIANGFQILSRPDYGDIIAKLYEQSRQGKLSQAALETLAIIAYKQPVMRVDVEDIRGVGVQPVLKNLLDMGLVRVVGRAEALGRPLLYGTTQKFLITFGLKSPKDLPSIEDLKAAE
jgi:segregation and condensation protein B